MQRNRVERIKYKLNDSTIDYYEKNQITARPNFLVRSARKLMYHLGIESEESEERRNREAMSIALSEYRKEEVERKALEEKMRIQELEEERKREMEKTERELALAESEKKALTNDMLIARGVLDRSKKQDLKNKELKK